MSKLRPSSRQLYKESKAPEPKYIEEPEEEELEEEEDLRLRFLEILMAEVAIKDKTLIDSAWQKLSEELKKETLGV
jgi:hypothetical protein